MSEFESLLEYEALYLQSPVAGKLRLPVVVEKMRRGYLDPLKLLRNRLDTMYRDAADFVDDSISTSYADANLDLSRKMTVLSCIQAAAPAPPAENPGHSE